MPYPVTVLSFLMTFPTGNQYLMVHSVDSCPSFPGISATPNPAIYLSSFHTWIYR